MQCIERRNVKRHEHCPRGHPPPELLGGVDEAGRPVGSRQAARQPHCGPLLRIAPLCASLRRTFCHQSVRRTRERSEVTTCGCLLSLLKSGQGHVRTGRDARTFRDKAKPQPRHASHATRAAPRRATQRRERRGARERPSVTRRDVQGQGAGQPRRATPRHAAAQREPGSTSSWCT